MQDRHGNTDSSLRGLLSRLFGGWGTNNAAGRATSPYFPQAPQAPQQSMPQAPTDSQALAQAQSAESGPMTDANLPQFAPSTRPHQGGPMQGMHQGYAAPLVARNEGMPITEGQNANIGDDSRQRAMQMIAALRNGGAL